MSVVTLCLVALGGGLGSVLRHALGQRYDDRWHHGTLAANTGASLLLGACVGWSLGGAALALAGTGFCGGLSTYSSLVVQSRDLGPRRGAAYATLTVLLGLGACALGFALAA